ncbi:hypothetical protein LTR36_003741 [Oleoguttula mirabilis]|uniref:Uncharacterized protein n=1 Tax=Oleoguttula mirabilis TaxID=1507867 RepID=A0AAV9JHF5_9PEZI|nr:hypothetical protein LTR36_003741 [Oleoguttula mirabilis]
MQQADDGGVQRTIKQETPVTMPTPTLITAPNQLNEPIEIGEEDEYVLLEHTRLTVRSGDELPRLRAEYEAIFHRQAKAMCGEDIQQAKHKRHLQDIAHAVSSAERRYIIDRHGKEWKKAMDRSEALLEADFERAKTIAEDEMLREDENAIFRRVLAMRRARLIGALKDEKRREAIYNDLKEI